jgi:hypothetical protein
VNRINIILFLILTLLVLRCGYIYKASLNALPVTPGVHDVDHIVSDKHEKIIRSSLLKCSNLDLPVTIIFSKTRAKGNYDIKHLYARFNRNIDNPHDGILILFTSADLNINVIRGQNLFAYMDDTVVKNFKDEVLDAGADIDRIVSAFSSFLDDMAEIKRQYKVFHAGFRKNSSAEKEDFYSLLTIIVLICLIVLLSIINIIKNRCPKCGALIKITSRDVPSQQKGEYVEIELKECSVCDYSKEKKIIVK